MQKLFNKSDFHGRIKSQHAFPNQNCRSTSFHAPRRSSVGIVLPWRHQISYRAENIFWPHLKESILVCWITGFVEPFICAAGFTQKHPLPLALLPCQLLQPASKVLGLFPSPNSEQKQRSSLSSVPTVLQLFTFLLEKMLWSFTDRSHNQIKTIFCLSALTVMKSLHLLWCCSMILEQIWWYNYWITWCVNIKTLYLNFVLRLNIPQASLIES